MSNEFDFDLVVVGGGSGGFGAAWAAARRGVRVLLIEAGPALGGTSTLGGVNTWEPSMTGPGLPAELFRRLARHPSAIGIGRTVKFWSADEPWGFSEIDPELPYRDTLRRCTFGPEDWRRATFEPDLMAAEMARVLADTGLVDLRLNTRFLAADVEHRSIARLVLSCAGQELSVRPRFVVDATGQIDVCTAAGCRTYLGVEPCSAYGEPGAPPAHKDSLNGVTLCYRVTPADSPGVEEIPPGVPDEPFKRGASICQYPCGDLNINPLPTMAGWEFRGLPAAEARRSCEERTLRHWHWLQAEKGFARYRMVGPFPLVGIREGPRLIARRVLTENDVRAGFSAQADAERGVALCEHALDVHGEGGRCTELQQPYVVPYDCLLPGEYDNVLVACRGAGFSHIAASSCRLTRVMMQLGHAAGLAAALAMEDNVSLPEADVTKLRRRLAEQNVALDPCDGRFPPPRGAEQSK